MAPEVIAKQRKERGAQVYVDISNADKPLDDDMRQEVPVTGTKRTHEEAALDGVGEESAGDGTPSPMIIDDGEIGTEPTDEPTVSMPGDMDDHGCFSTNHRRSRTSSSSVVSTHCQPRPGASAAEQRGDVGPWDDMG